MGMVFQSCNGEPFDVTCEEGSMSLAILKKAASEMSYCTGSDEYPNHMTLRIKG